MAHGHHHYDITKPAKYELPKAFLPACVGMILAGIVCLLIAFFTDPVSAWKAYLIGFWFSMGFAAFGPFFVSTQHLSIASWSVPIRRIPEAMGAALYPTFIFGVIGMFLIPEEIWAWKNMEVALQDGIFAKKAGFFQIEYFYLTTVATLGIWAAVYTVMRKLSLNQDEQGGYEITNRLKAVSALYLICFTVGISFMAWYWLMSLEPNWFSTMFSVYTFAGLWQAGLALTYVLMIYLGSRNAMGVFLGGRQVHDLGKMVFGFTVFYAYIGFCQFLLIWYANIPEEDIWYVQRLDGDWVYFTLALPFIKFIIPFFIMLRQKIKKNHWNVMIYVCLWIIFCQMYEVWYWVAPEPHGLVTDAAHATGHHGGHVSVGATLLQMGTAVGFFGVFALVSGWAFAKHNTIPIKDPFLHETLPDFTHEEPLAAQHHH